MAPSTVSHSTMNSVPGIGSGRRRPGSSARPPYGAPQVDVLPGPNTIGNPSPRSVPLAGQIAEAGGAGPTALNRYPDRDAVGLRRDLAGYLGSLAG